MRTFFSFVIFLSVSLLVGCASSNGRHNFSFSNNSSVETPTPTNNAAITGGRMVTSVTQ